MGAQRQCDCVSMLFFQLQDFILISLKLMIKKITNDSLTSWGRKRIRPMPWKVDWNVLHTFLKTATSELDLGHPDINLDDDGK